MATPFQSVMTAPCRHRLQIYAMSPCLRGLVMVTLAAAGGDMQPGIDWNRIVTKCESLRGSRKICFFNPVRPVTLPGVVGSTLPE